VAADRERGRSSCRLGTDRVVVAADGGKWWLQTAADPDPLVELALEAS
jgi:hypothetical protein